MSKITIKLEFNQQQAEQYLQWLNSQFDTTMADIWYSDRYRNVPCGQRAPKVIQDIPYLAGICRTRRELKKQLSTNAGECSR